MMRRLFFSLLITAVTAGSVFAAATTVVLNGKTVAIPAIESQGKAYVDVAALMKLLGGSASYTAANHKVVITTAGQAAAQPAKTTSAASQGTAALPGDNGELNKVYSLGKNSPLYIALVRAEYTVDQVKVGDTLYTPTADEKLLVLHFTVQNPRKEEAFVRWDSLKFTAVDAMNVNHEGDGYWGDEESKNSVALSLKPAQKIAVYTAIRVPAKGQVPKLMVLPTDDSPVLRYDLRDKVTPLAAPFADPADTLGVTALTTVPAKTGVAFPFENYDITIEKFAYTNTALGEIEPDEGGRLLQVYVTMKNQNPSEQYLRWDTLTPMLTSTDGEELSYKDMLLATSDRSIGQNIKPGQEIKVRCVFSIPAGVTPKTLALHENESRTYEFAVTE